DSFSDGGQFIELGAAIKQAKRMVDEGADIIDVGGESTRPGSRSVNEKVELNRVIPVINELVRQITVPISIDTTKSKIALESLKAGASMINDTSASKDDPRMMEVAAKAKVPMVLMHRLRKPRTMQDVPTYNSLMGDLM